jgi:hypothetical protein
MEVNSHIFIRASGLGGLITSYLTPLFLILKEKIMNSIRGKSNIVLFCSSQIIRLIIRICNDVYSAAKVRYTCMRALMNVSDDETND